MTVRDMVEKMALQVLAGEEGMNQEIEGGYIGDLLSFVMSHAKEKNIWITIQGHINSVAVASLLGLSAIILAEGAEADAEMLRKANEEEIPIISTTQNSFDFANSFSKLEC